MLISLLTALLSGVLMSVQGVFNTRVSDKAGTWLATSIVHFLALIVAVVILLFVGDARFEGLKSVNKFYLLGGFIGVAITYTVITSMAHLGPAYAVMFILIAQMISAYLIELFGLFDTPKSTFMWTKLAGVGLMLAGIILFQWKK